MSHFSDSVNEALDMDLNACLDASVSVEDCLVAMSAAVSGINIRSSSWMNKAIVIFMSQSQMVNDLIESKLMIN